MRPTIFALFLICSLFFLGSSQTVIRRPIVVPAGSDLSTGLVSYWKLEEGSGNRVDELGTNTLTSTGAGLTNGSGKIGSAAQFDGSNYLHKADNASLNFGTKMTVEFWLYQSTIGTNKGIVGQWLYQTDGSWQIQTTNGGADLLIFIADSAGDGGGNDGFTTTASMANATFYHWVIVYDGTQSGNANRLVAYKNGSPITLSYGGTIAASLQNASGDLNVGLFDGLARFMGSGDRLDEAALWNVALTSSQAARLYNSGSGCQYTFGGCP